MTPLAVGTLFDWPALQGDGVPGRLCVVGAPNDQGNPIARGAALGPSAIRQASRLLAEPACLGFDCGDIERPNAADPSIYLQTLIAEIERLHAIGLCPLLLGGDHSLTFAPVSVLQRDEDMCVVWFDAHTDFSPWSGAAAHDHKQVLRRISLLPNVRRVVQIGYRGVTVGDERRLGDENAVVTTTQARALDEHALLALIPVELPCYVSIDIDVIDPLWAPGTGAPVPDGLLPEEVAKMLSTLVLHRRIVGVDLVEVNPRLDLGMRTSAIGAMLIHAVAQAWSHQHGLQPTMRHAHLRTERIVSNA